MDADPAPSQSSVRVSLTPRAGTPDDCTACRTRSRRRAARVTEAPEFAAAARRMIAALGRRAEHEDILPLLAELSEQVDQTLNAAVHLTRTGEQPASWAEIGQALGITRQSAHERFTRARTYVIQGGTGSGSPRT